MVSKCEPSSPPPATELAEPSVALVTPSSITLSLILTSFGSSLMSFTFHLHSFILVVAPSVGNVADAAAMDTVIAVQVDGNLPSFRYATQPRQPSHGELLLL